MHGILHTLVKNLPPLIFVRVPAFIHHSFFIYPSSIMSHSFPQIYSSTVIHHHSSYILLLLFLLLLLSLSLLLSLLPRSFISATSVVTPPLQFLFSSPGVPLIVLFLGCAYYRKPQNFAMLKKNSFFTSPGVLCIQSPLNSPMFITPYRLILCHVYRSVSSYTPPYFSLRIVLYSAIFII